MRHLALLPIAALSSLLAAQSPVTEALQNGKISLEERTRYEHDEDSAYTAPATHKTANAFTTRTILGYTSGPVYDITANLEFLNVTAVGRERYNSTVNGQTQYATVQDPGLTQVNQAYLAYKGLKVGRQIIALDNQRFIGSGAWSQTPKTFTAAVYQNSTWVPMSEFTVGHISSYYSSVGVDQKLSGNFGRLRFSPWEALNITPLWFGIEQTATPATSFQHRGVRVDGKWNGLLYEGSYVQQRSYRDSTTTPDRQYRMGMVGYSRWGLTVKAVDEELEGGFSTPFASLHGFYGYSDRISTTPTKGLADRYLLAEYKRWDSTFEVQSHRFIAQKGGQDYGRELDFVASRNFSKNLLVTLEWADYLGDAGAPTAQSMNKDLKKLWLMTTLKF